MNSFRVFVSYSHEDKALAKTAVTRLESLGFHVLWDQRFDPGRSFTEAIKTRIAGSHLFLPLLTANSVSRSWVHQEIGYAMGMEVPVLPLAIGEMPGQMLQDLHALETDTQFQALVEYLNEGRIERLALPPNTSRRGVYERVDYPEKRIELIVQYANKVREFNSYGRIRQKGALSSFCLPDKPPDDPIWAEREGTTQRSPFYHEFQRQERKILEEHARVRGCDLMIDLSFEFPDNGLQARRIRLQTLQDFLYSMEEMSVRVVLQSQREPGNLLLVGDWFSAESITPQSGRGYRQTAFTWHAPSVLDQVRNFDREFESLLQTKGISGDASRLIALEEIRKAIIAIKV